MSIYKKLLKVQEQIKGLSKDKKSFSYEYVTGNKLLSFIKPILNKEGLLLKQEIVKVEKERVDYNTKKGSKSEILYSVWQKFTWIDAETGEKDENEFFASGMNDWEKGLGSALTYAERYFLLKYFHIATDEDDIDNPARKEEEEKERQLELSILSTALESKEINKIAIKEHYGIKGKLIYFYGNKSIEEIKKASEKILKKPNIDTPTAEKLKYLNTLITVKGIDRDKLKDELEVESLKNISSLEFNYLVEEFKKLDDKIKTGGEINE